MLIQGRPLRTHAVTELVLPTEGLARAIAGEFAAQGDVILPATTPLYNLACLAVDLFVHEDLAEAEDFEALARATRLSTFDRMQAQAILREEKEASAAGSIVTATLSSVVAGTAPSHAVTAAITGRNDAGALSSSASSGTAKLRDLMLDFLETDSICYRVDEDIADPSERLLRKRQDRLYQPLMDWFKGSFGVTLGTAVGIGDVTHPDEAYEVAEDAADTASPWVKAAMQQSVGVLKSSVVTLALVNRAISVEDAFEASRVEEEWQIGENGFVEDGHDTGRAHTRAQLTAVSTFLWLLPASAMPAALPLAGKKGYNVALASARAARAARVLTRRMREAAAVSSKRAIMLKMAVDDERAAAGPPA